MNFINLMEILKNQVDFTTYNTLFSDFMETYRAEYQKIRPCKSVMERAIKKYVASATNKDEKVKGVYTTGATVLILSQDIPEAESENIKAVSIAEKVMEIWKNKRPTDCYFIDSIALYKALKKQESGNYLLHIEGNYYNAALIAEMVECIADNKEAYIQAEICQNGALLIKQKYAALIIPVKCNGCHPSKNINIQDFLKYCDSIEKSCLDEIKKSA